MALDLTATMDAMASALSAFPGHVYAWPTDTIQPPCAIVAYPTTLEFDLTFQRGADHATIPVFVICGLASAEATRDVVADFVQGSGDIKTALDGNLSGAVDSLRVTDCTIERVVIGAQAYISLRFDTDVIA